MPTPTDTLRQKIEAALLEVPGLGGVSPDPALRKVHRYAFETDDIEEARAFWETVDAAGNPVINAAMVTRLSVEDQEPMDGKEFVRVHTFRVLFRYGRRGEVQAEKTFEGFVDAIVEKLRGNPAVFQVDGLHPQPHADQVAEARMRNIKLFGMRVYEAEIEFKIVVRL